MRREGTRHRHPGERILPLAIVDATGEVDLRCLACGRYVHLDARRGDWRHHVRRWTLRRRPRGIAA